MLSTNEEFVSLANGHILIWNRDTGSVRDLGVFNRPGFSFGLTFYDMDVAPDGTVYGLSLDTMYRLDLDTNRAIAVAQTEIGANSLDVTPSGDFIIGYINTDEIVILNGDDFSYQRSLFTDGLAAGSGSDLAGDVQLIGSTLYMTGLDGGLVGLNYATGQEVYRLTDSFVSTVFGLATQDGSLIFFAGDGAYRLNGDTFVRTDGFQTDVTIIGGGDAYFPSVSFNPTAAADQLTGSDFSDTIYGLGGSDTILGRAGDDLILAGSGADSAAGGLGYDEIYGGTGADTIAGGTGNDTLYGGGGSDAVYGGLDQDLVGGAAGNDQVYGGGGNDTVGGGGGNDQAFGGAGNDLIYGSEGTDQVYGGTGADTAYGGNDSDTVSGGGGDDLLSGGTGNDRIVGGAGNDTMRGGQGTDTFVFAPSFGADVIQDFNPDDLVDLSALSTSDAQNPTLSETVVSGVSGVLYEFASGSVFFENIGISDISAEQFIY